MRDRAIRRRGLLTAWALFWPTLAIVLIALAAGVGGTARSADTAPADAYYPTIGEPVQMYFAKGAPPIPTFLPLQGFPLRAAVVTWVYPDEAPARAEITVHGPQQSALYYSHVPPCNATTEPQCFEPLPGYPLVAAPTVAPIVLPVAPRLTPFGERQP